MIKGEHSVKEAFENFTNSVYPYAVGKKSATDEAMVAAMKKETDKGPITFTPMELTPLRDAAKRMSLPDDFRKRLEERTKKVRLK
jgi:hypothetical protein